MKTGSLMVMVIMAIFLAGRDTSYGCTVCHSKNPKMVAMHERPENKACFNCHGRGIIKPRNELSSQMANDTLCVDCHRR